MHYKLMFPSAYLSACDLQGREVVVEIEEVKLEDLTMVGGRKSKKGTIKFKGKEKKFVLNKTNATVIAKQHGTDTEQWVGKKITIYPTTTKFAGDEVECLRVK